MFNCDPQRTSRPDKQRLIEKKKNIFCTLYNNSNDNTWQTFDKHYTSN